MTSLSVVIPAYNEEAALGDILRRCMDVLPRCTDEFEVTVIDDGSTDATPKVLEEWRARYPGHIRVVTHERRHGMAETFEEGYRVGTKEYVVFLHGDGQYPPEMLAECMRLLPENDIVLMTRRKKYYSPYRAVLSWGYRALPFLLFGVDLRDPGCSKCVRRGLIEDIPISSTSVFAEAERVIRAMRRGHRIAFLLVESAPRRSGVAQGGSLSHALSAIRDMVQIWWRGDIPL